MKLLAFAAIASLALSGCATVPPEAAAPGNETKVAFDLIDGNPQVLLLKLNTIDLTRKQLIDAGRTPRMVLTFRGEASYYTQTELHMVKEADRAEALQIRAKLKELKAAKGVESLEQCNVPLASRKLKKEALMSEVKLVPNGWIALVDYQQKGYAYIAP
ncbi:MAG TPA: DsrE family protein [Usitatibacter sp.]|nr:DsrE family protein [Usitatibacter sp.]